MCDAYVKVADDLNYIFDHMPLKSLLHLQANAPRLIRGQYQDGLGGKCIFGLLTECLPAERQITEPKALTRYFGGDREAAHYQPARAIVRLWDGHDRDAVVVARYGVGARLPKRFLLRVLRGAIRRRMKHRPRRTLGNSPDAQPAGLPPHRTVTV